MTDTMWRTYTSLAAERGKKYTVWTDFNRIIMENDNPNMSIGTKNKWDTTRIRVRRIRVNFTYLREKR